MIFVPWFHYSLKNSLNKLDQIKTLIVGGAPISDSVKDKLQNTSCQVFETYGMTETITHIAVKRINNKPQTIFNTLPNISISTDDRGCLAINAPRLSDQVIVTNDIVNVVSENEFEWLGRYDNVINSGGVKLFPEQIEAKLSKLVSNRFFVAGLADEKLGQKLVLIVEGGSDTRLLSEEITKLSSLNKYEMPKEIKTLPKFLETDSGKIRRREIKNQLL